MNDDADDRETITLTATQWSAIVLALGFVDRNRAWGPHCHEAKREIMRQRDEQAAARDADEAGHAAKGV